MTKKILAIIPARGGSKGLPKKNTLNLAGKPLIAWTIEAALDSRCIDQVIVSTDDKDILDISKKYDCEIIKRPSELSGDKVTMLPVVKHALEYLGIQYEENTVVVLLQPTSPLRTHTHIDSAVKLFTDKWTSVVGVCEAEHTPYKMYNIVDSRLEDFTSKRWRGLSRQEIAPVYRENGAIFVFDSNQVINNNTLRGNRPRAFIMDTIYSIDIDTNIDLMIAELYNTPTNYLYTFNGYLKDWGNKELLNISRDMVEKRHRKITKKSPTRANTTMRLLRALFNYAMGEYGDAKSSPIILHNPVSILSHIKAWNRETRKQTIIKTHELKTWWDAIQELPTHKLNTKNIHGTTYKQPNHSKTARDFFIFVLMTGLRRREASNLTWANIDFKNRGLTIENTKNHETHTLPLTDYLITLLNQRKANTDSIFVFEGNDPSKPINTLQKQVVKARTISGIYFSIHDLRRTFITIAESLSIREYTLKRLMNHKNARDVTAGYIIKEIESLRQPMEKISNFILEQVK